MSFNNRKLGIVISNPYLNPLNEISDILSNNYNNYVSGSGFLNFSGTRFISGVATSVTIGIPITGQDNLLIY